MNCMALNILFWSKQTSMSFFRLFTFRTNCHAAAPSFYSKCTFHGLTVIDNLCGGAEKFQESITFTPKCLSIRNFATVFIRNIECKFFLFIIVLAFITWHLALFDVMIGKLVGVFTTFFVNYKRW